MKYIAFLFIIGLNLFAQADTITNWQFYLDDSRLSKCNLHGCDEPVRISSDQIDSTSTLKVYYYECAMRYRTDAWMEVTDSLGNVIYTWRGRYDQGLREVPLLDLVHSGHRRFKIIHHYNSPWKTVNVELGEVVLE